MYIDWEETVFCAVDTETTGLNPESGDRIIEIALVPIYKGRLILKKSYVTLINPEIYIPYDTEKIHNISNEKIKKAPYMKDVFPIIRYYLTNMVPVFHNGKFDLSFLDFSAKDIGEFPINPFYIDTSELALEIFGEYKTLEWLARRFLNSERINHRALDDAIVTGKVFVKLARRIGYENLGKFLKKWSGAPV